MQVNCWKKHQQSIWQYSTAVSKPSNLTSEKTFMEEFSIGKCSSIEIKMLHKIMLCLPKFCFRETRGESSNNINIFYFDIFRMKHFNFFFWNYFSFQIVYILVYIMGYSTKLKSQNGNISIKQKIWIFFGWEFWNFGVMFWIGTKTNFENLKSSVAWSFSSLPCSAYKALLTFPYKEGCCLVWLFDIQNFWLTFCL